MCGGDIRLAWRRTSFCLGITCVSIYPRHSVTSGNITKNTMRHFEKTQVSTQGPSQAVNLAGAEVARPQPIKVRQGTADSLGAVQDPSQSDKAASSAGSTLGGETMLHTSGSGGKCRGRIGLNDLGC